MTKRKSNNLRFPRVGVGVILVNKKGEILVGKRKGSHAQKYSIPGGSLEIGETFEAAATREIKEETGLTIKKPKVIAVTNNLETFRQEGIHYISAILLVKTFSGKLRNREPEKCERWLWVNPRRLPKPHFDASRLAVACYLRDVPYLTLRQR